MPTMRILIRRLLLIALAAVALACPVGCDRIRPPQAMVNRPQAKPYVVPPGIAGTVAEFANLVGGEDMVVRGYGVVAGLGENGSTELPPNLEKYLIRLMTQYKVVAPSSGSPVISPARLLQDKDTAVVVIEGRIPPAAPAGSTFDLTVEALPGTQTISLDGGTLYTCELQLALTTTTGDVGSGKTLATGRGPIFVNPFDRDRPEDAAKLRIGKVPGGGQVLHSRPIHLELRQPDWRMVTLIERQINQHFSGRVKVANARSPALVEVQVPPERRKDYQAFLRQVTHVHLMSTSGSDERYAQQLTAAITQPTALFEDISLTWETMGRQVLPIVRPLYAHNNEAVSYFALRAGVRLEDELAMQPMIQFAHKSNSLFQLHAIAELGKAHYTGEPLLALKPLLSDKNELVRVAAYEALLEQGPTSAIQRFKITRDFTVDVVDNEGAFTIYATRTGEPKLVLFGRDIPILRPMFFCPADELVTISARQEDEKLLVFRKIPRRVPGCPDTSDPFYVRPTVQELVAKLAGLPQKGKDGQIEGLGLTYSQVVGVLYKLYYAKHISADFVLQRSPEMRKIYLTAGATGRPDMPEQQP